MAAKRRFLTSGFLLFFLVQAVPAWPQAPPQLRAREMSVLGVTLHGVVTDPGGAVLAGVSIECNVGKRVVRAVTDSLGRFELPGVIGEIEVIAFSAGFGRVTRRVSVGPGESATLRLVLGAPIVLATPRPSPTAIAISGKNYSLIRVHFATDRASTDNANPEAVFASERGDVSYGHCDVSIPRDHRMGEIERPTVWKLEFREDPEKHVVIVGLAREGAEEFLKTVGDDVRQSKDREAFVFIHGYNVTFANAARRTAQLAYDLSFDGAAILYSWPSRGTYEGYPDDEATVESTVPHLAKFLEDLRRSSGARTIHLIAHSMGNRALVRALDKIATSGEILPLFKEVVLAAPDIDAQVFAQLADQFRTTAERVTLYGSSNDLAIQVSRKFHGFQRAGEGGTSLPVLPGIESIDATALDTGLVGHGYVGENRSVISDLFGVIRSHLAPGKRAGLKAQLRGPLPYWLFVP